MNKPRKTLFNVLVLASVLVIAYFLYHSLSAGYTPKTQTNTQNTSPRIPAPDFIVCDINKKAYKLSDFKGTPIVLNFWASWCPACKEELPAFEKLYDEYKNDVHFMMVDIIDTQKETFETGTKFIKDNNYHFPAYFDKQQEAKYYFAVSSIPMTIFIDKDGNIVEGKLGAMSEETLRSKIKNLIGK
ncbi:MAG: redoxin domain-containing protein [Clostridiales bacterium]|nr:redoxin domain-containing protein [Clostridiales bacterium]